MFVFENENCVFVDVDQTLIIKMAPNYELIEKIREWKDKGRKIVVWTSNTDGVKHAIKAIDFCGIREEVDVVMAKPNTIVDDDHLEYYNTIDPETLEWRDRER